MLQPRVYRAEGGAADLVRFSVCVGPSDLEIQAETDLREVALRATKRAYNTVLRHVRARPSFQSSLKPLPLPAGADPLVAAMYRAAEIAGVGPMAAVAGAIAEAAGRELLQHSGQVIVENGGDVFLSSRGERVVEVRAGASPLSGRFGLLIPGGETLGVCTSSATVGPSLSAGRADAAVAVADDAALADAVATALGNRVTCSSTIEPALEWGRAIAGVRALVVICQGQLGVWGEFELRPLPRRDGRPSGAMSVGSIPGRGGKTE